MTADEAGIAWSAMMENERERTADGEVCSVIAIFGRIADVGWVADEQGRNCDVRRYAAPGNVLGLCPVAEGGGVSYVQMCPLGEDGRARADGDGGRRSICQSISASY